MEIKTEILTKLSPKIQKAIKLIESSAKAKQVIFLRYHNDCDGYTAAVALDTLIHKKISENHFKERDTFYFYRRQPCQAPFYSFEDSTRDINYIYDSMVTRNKEPLMVLVDNGSSEQDLEGLRRLKTYGFRIIVIDHHPPSELVDDVVDIHINPWHVKKDPLLSAGTLAAHIAFLGMQQKHEEFYNFLAAISSISDKAEGEEYRAVFEKVKNKYSYDELKLIGDVVDYESQRSGYIESWVLIKELLTNQGGKREEIIKTSSNNRKYKQEQSLKTSLKYADTKIDNDKVVTWLDIGSTSFRGDYPSMRVIIGSLHREIEAKNKDKEVITFAYSSEMITLRANDKSKFDSNKIIKNLKESFPYAKIDGGGHPHAASIRFISASRDEIIQAIKKLI
ncbi:hypothetical protein GOV05_01105 [Candidatus Woesearchaeota archaeon]|nr:hypothetical protein [Candidatus Woesearchaeota archaeon]